MKEDLNVDLVDMGTYGKTYNQLSRDQNIICLYINVVIKLLMQKLTMKGTFLISSYIINKY